MALKSFVIKADICYSETPQVLNTMQDGFLVCVKGRSAGVFQELPEQYAALPLLDCSGSLAVPGLTDLHVHAPQYAFRGLGMDLELLEWLNTHTFPEESLYADLEYAGRAYRRFVEDLMARMDRGENVAGLLPELNRAGAGPDCLKAVLTSHNHAWSAVRLYEELWRERQAMERGRP